MENWSIERLHHTHTHTHSATKIGRESEKKRICARVHTSHLVRVHPALEQHIAVSIFFTYLELFMSVPMTKVPWHMLHIRTDALQRTCIFRFDFDRCILPSLSSSFFFSSILAFRLFFDARRNVGTERSDTSMNLNPITIAGNNR